MLYKLNIYNREDQQKESKQEKTTRLTFTFGIIFLFVFLFVIKLLNQPSSGSLGTFDPWAAWCCCCSLFIVFALLSVSNCNGCMLLMLPRIALLTLPNTFGFSTSILSAKLEFIDSTFCCCWCCTVAAFFCNEFIVVAASGGFSIKGLSVSKIFAEGFWRVDETSEPKLEPPVNQSLDWGLFSLSVGSSHSSVIDFVTGVGNDFISGLLLLFDGWEGDVLGLTVAKMSTGSNKSSVNATLRRDPVFELARGPVVDPIAVGT